MNDFDKRKCVELTNKMLHKDLCRPFREKVDPERDGAPDYLEIVKNPMDLTTVRKKLVAGEYKSISEWSDDVNLIFDWPVDSHVNTFEKILSSEIPKHLEKIHFKTEN